MPQRIQYRGRQRGWTMPPNTVYVGRHATAFGRWGNPFRVEDQDAKLAKVDARQACVDLHSTWLDGSVLLHDAYTFNGFILDRRWVFANLHLLAGRDLACWCPTGPCHANTLLTLAAQVSVTA